MARPKISDIRQAAVELDRLNGRRDRQAQHPDLAGESTDFVRGALVALDWVTGAPNRILDRLASGETAAPERT
jgi:hypothetical protein